MSAELFVCTLFNLKSTYFSPYWQRDKLSYILPQNTATLKVFNWGDFLQKKPPNIQVSSAKLLWKSKAHLNIQVLYNVCIWNYEGIIQPVKHRKKSLIWNSECGLSTAFQRRCELIGENPRERQMGASETGPARVTRISIKLNDWGKASEQSPNCIGGGWSKVVFQKKEGKEINPTHKTS